MNNLIPKPFLQKNNSSTIKPIDEGMRGFISIPILLLLLLLLLLVVVVVVVVVRKSTEKSYCLQTNYYN